VSGRAVSGTGVREAGSGRRGLWHGTVLQVEAVSVAAVLSPRFINSVISVTQGFVPLNVQIIDALQVSVVTRRAVTLAE
jgi:hypothetical protein